MHSSSSITAAGSALFPVAPTPIRTPGRRMVLALVAALCLSASAWGQFNASLSGTVEDTTGAIIPGATVTLTDLGTQQKRVVTSSDAGSFLFNALPPGKYRVAVIAAGFKESDTDNVAVAAETPRNLDVKLETGGNTETVTVNGDTLPLLQVDNANQGRVLSSEEIKRLPIFGADPYELLRTTPGITGDGARSGNGNAVFLPNNVGVGGSNSGIYQTENQIQISADGQRESDNNFMIDGVSVNSLTHGGSAVVTPNQESVDSIATTAVSFDAADGRNSGAQVKVTTKSGTNDLHGSLYFLYNEPGLDAFNRYGGPVAGSKPVRVAIKQRTYAASLGGPIIKDKLFLFGSFQGFGNSNNTISQNLYVETAQYRAAVIAGRPGGLSAATLATPGIAPRVRNIVASDCSAFVNQPNTYVPTQVNGSGPVVAQTAQSGPYCNVVPGGLDIGSLTPGGASQLGVYLPVFSTGQPGAPGPATQVGGGLVGGGLDGVPDVQQVQLFVPSHSRGNQFNGRLDFHATSKDLVAGSIYITKLDNLTNSAPVSSRQSGDIPFKPLNSAATFIYIHTFSPSWLNEFRSNGTRFADNGLRDFGNINLGIPFTYVQQGIPFTNQIQFGVQGGSTTAAILAQNTYEISDQVSHTFGSHSIKVGGGLRWEQDNDNLNGAARPDFDFAGLWNLANDAPFFELQTVNAANGLGANNAAHFRSQTYYGFVQHDWKVTPTFTLNSGFRYEIQTPWHRKGGANSFLPAFGTGPSGPLVGLSLQPVRNLYNSDYGHYGPKLGFAWNPNFFNNKVVVRGGFATAYNHLDLSLFENVVQNGPGTFQFGVCCGTSSQDFSTPFDGGVIKYVHGTSNSNTSYPANPAFATGVNAQGFPLQIGGTPAQVELYGVGGKVKNPISYLYTLGTETLLAGNVTLDIGYEGSVGRHYTRLVNQNFLYATNFTDSSGVTTQTPASNTYFAQTDSSQAYNSLNVRVMKQLRHGLQFDGTYTWAKGMDNITNGNQSNGSANQTNPANNRSEWGPSDNDVRNRFVGTVLYTTPQVHTGHRLVNALASGYQASSVITLHSGFHWTPVVGNGFNSIPNASVVSPIRPIAYAPGASQTLIGTSCSNAAFKSGSNFANRGTAGTDGGTAYYSTTQPSATVPYIPVVGRNSLTGPCYRDVDFSLAKEVTFEGLGHTAGLRFQANIYNALNLLQLQPITNEGFGTNVQDPNFGKSAGADAGRVVEFLARFTF